MKTKILVLFFAVITQAAHAQFGSSIVYDPTQGGHAIQQIRQSQQLYTTAITTRDTVIGTYNLAQQMASLPNSLYTRYVTPWTAWNSVSSPNTYGNVQAVINAINTGANAAAAYQAASIQAAPQNPSYGNLDPASQQVIAVQGANLDLGDGIAASNIQMLGNMRANSQAREADLRELEAATYSSDPTQHTDMATLQRLNQAALMQLRSQQEANELSQAMILQQMIAAKQQQDHLKMASQAQDSYEQQYDATMTPLTSNISASMADTH